MDKTSLGDRMKSYENTSRTYLTPMLPIIIRVDGKAFHTYTKGFEKPWDNNLKEAMTSAATLLMEEVQGAEFAYIQSDEISLVLNTYKRFSTQSWFQGNIQKISSVAAGLATAGFNKAINSDKVAIFDGRCFVLPVNDVVNYFVWRQRDATRNSVLSYAQFHLGHKNIQNKNVTELKKMLLDKGFDWSNDVEVSNQRGWGVCREQVDSVFYSERVVRNRLKPNFNLPIFSEERSFFDKFLERKEG